MLINIGPSKEPSDVVDLLLECHGRIRFFVDQPALDAALQAMHREHRQHKTQLQSLLKSCRILEASPERLEDLREMLDAAASILEGDFVTHLRQEEVVMPAIRSLLTNEERDAMFAELRARRSK